ncbi:MAG: response regulator [Verrucomicrobia bacterium]|nr:response regulator [Verrucomicrobiota bacterium]MCH8513262.1 response regulator [Kiritimatiellia bacterium]
MKTELNAPETRTPIEEADARTDQANARTDEANIRTDQANTRTGEANIRAEMAETLRASELRYRRLFESAKDGILILDAETGMIVDVNPFLINLLGLSHADFLGKEVWELGLFKHIVANKAKFVELQAQKYVRYDDLPLETVDGRQIAVEFVSNVYLEKDNKVIQCNIRDISERRNLEAQILRVQRMESIGTLASGIAHDLNNVLTPILMAVEILGGKMSDAEDREMLATLESSAKHGAELIRQVLGFACGIEGQRIRVNPIDILHKLQKIVRDTFPKNIHFTFAPSCDLWMVTGDSTQLQQVFTNLCVNARDAMPEGGDLSVSMENTQINETDSGMNPDVRLGAYVMVKLTDNGVGMFPKVMDRIFEPFFTTKEIGMGSGMGLSTTMAIVKSHGGFITVSSEMGQGSTFKVYLPANTTTKADDMTIQKQVHLPRGNGEWVLLVDDEEYIRIIAQKTLERFGYHVLLASNGAEAVATYAAHREKIAIVVTDMSMPVLDGADTLVALRVMNPDIKAIACSGLTVNGESPQATGAGFKHFIAKPFTVEAILTILAKALRE